MPFEARVMGGGATYPTVPETEKLSMSPRAGEPTTLKTKAQGKRKEYKNTSFHYW